MIENIWLWVQHCLQFVRLFLDHLILEIAILELFSSVFRNKYRTFGFGFDSVEVVNIFVQLITFWNLFHERPKTGDFWIWKFGVILWKVQREASILMDGKGLSNHAEYFLCYFFSGTQILCKRTYPTVF